MPKQGGGAWLVAAICVGLAASLVAPSAAQMSGQHAKQRYDKATKGASIDDFVKRLGSEDGDVRLEAVKSLGTSGEPKAVEYLIQAMGDPDVRVQAKAITILGDLHATDAVTILVQYLSRTTTNTNLKQMILAALGKIGDARAAIPIVEFLQRDLDPSTRGTGVFALGEIAATDSLDSLKRIAANDEDPSVRRLAGEALSKVEYRQAAVKREVKAPSQNFLKPKDEPPPQQ